MGRENQPEIGGLNSADYKKDRRTWSQKWEDRANRATDLSRPGFQPNPQGPPPGIPIGRKSGGAGPIQVGKNKLFPHQLWTKQHEASYRLGITGDKGVRNIPKKRPKKGDLDYGSPTFPHQSLSTWDAPQRPMSPRQKVISDKLAADFLKKGSIGYELLTEEGEREARLRRGPLFFQGAGVAGMQRRAPQNPEEELQLKAERDRLLRHAEAREQDRAMEKAEEVLKRRAMLRRTTS